MRFLLGTMTEDIGSLTSKAEVVAILRRELGINKDDDDETERETAAAAAATVQQDWDAACRSGAMFNPQELPWFAKFGIPIDNKTTLNGLVNDIICLH